MYFENVHQTGGGEGGGERGRDERHGDDARGSDQESFYRCFLIGPGMLGWLNYLFNCLDQEAGDRQ